ncbi:hypothetical protein PITCH_A1150096 [uncultured Desulfobacterium sp.]|uniref:Uncharacterized protein n=1 Tax=uncultured Desulfobacterium sp. TaxID=201089 RepID=A0A445MRN1_9BACT|nr:hypothetical protein PITCH_A1150096 [uncultured Desulfobacterium sp.]
MMAQGRDFNTIFLGDLKDILSFFPLNFYAIKFKSNHLL